MSNSSTQSLFFDGRFLYADGDASSGNEILPETVTATKQNIQKAVEKVTQAISQHQYGFIEVLSETQYLEEVKQVFAQMSWAKTFVVVGIGGSDLGARAVQQALEKDMPPMTVLFHGDSSDPIQIKKLLSKIDLEETIFNIVSKSGQTVETTAQYIFFKNLYKKNGSDWSKHFVFTTDPEEGILRQEANQYGILTASIPPSVGGRFSVLTPVGLLPALAMGVDIDALIQGARDFIGQASNVQMVQAFAESQLQLYQQGTKVVVIMPYALQLEEFGRWFRQLWAESLGKDGKGILPIQARGPADQHSQVQFYTQGSALQSLLFIRINESIQNYTLENIDLQEMQYLAGHSFHEILNFEQEATALALKKQKRPSATLAVGNLSVQTLGQLFLFFELAVVYVAEMLGVNAFDQPGVEEGKQMMYALLGRPGFTEKKTELENLRK
jgi:glucose-6-phosphate isomerase